MNLSPEVLQFLGSLIAILAVAGLAWRLGLGGQPKLETEEDARRAADEAIDGFAPVEIAIDESRVRAIMTDDSGQILILKPHGNKFAGRLLTRQAQAKVWTDRGFSSLEVDCAEKRFGKVFLEIDNPQAWVDRINALGSPDDA